ncbi:MAG: hypothetical protein KBE65_07100 [Phycisphaerae bacterium]|nr:hypothetical protein [Phycisphaerae bacterium]
MHRQGIPVVSIVLALACCAGAFVGQEQGFSIGAANFLTWPGGVGSVEGGHQASFGHQQTVHSGWGWNTAWGVQREGGFFTQNASISGNAPTCVGQDADIAGGQQQNAGTWGPVGTSQGQQMGVGFSTSIVTPWGSGATTASQTFSGGQMQTLASPTAMGTQSQFVDLSEYASIVGGVVEDPTVTNSISVGLSQNQQAAAPCAPPCWR